MGHWGAARARETAGLLLQQPRRNPDATPSDPLETCALPAAPSPPRPQMLAIVAYNPVSLLVYARLGEW
jgi:hypothetical protein